MAAERTADGSTPPSRWLDRLCSPWAAGIVLTAFYALILLSVREKSATLDEPGHATAGYTYWKYGDYRLDPENGNLPQRLIALPLVASAFRFPERESPAWKSGDIVGLANRWIYDLGNDTEAILFRGRAAIAVLAVGLGIIVWWWSRELFGPAGGMFSLLLYVLNPAVLANSGLMTSDIATACLLLLSVYYLWKALQQPSLLRIVASAVVMGAALLTKVSAVIILPVALLLGFARVLDQRPFGLGGARTLVTLGQRTLGLTGVIVVHAPVAALVIWACYGFRFATSPSAERIATIPAATQQDVSKVKAQAGGTDDRRSAQRKQLDAELAKAGQSASARLAEFALRHELLPEAFIYGYAHVWKSTSTRVAFLNGKMKLNEGWLLFFPFAILVKTPLALLAIAAVTLFVGWQKGRRYAAKFGAAISSSILPLVLFVVVYLAAAIASNINIGHRHILPIYPPVFVLCGAVASRTLVQPLSWLPRLAWPLIALLTVETLCWFPNYLAYFNGIVRPARAYRHLIDSSLDWGQDLPALRRYLEERRPAGRRYLALFGNVRPDHYGIAATRLYTGVAFPLAILRQTSLPPNKTLVEDFLRNHPEYDQRVIATTVADGAVGSVVLKKASELRLSGGTYFISASLVQPIYTGLFGPWNETYETTYQELKKSIAPLLSDDLKPRSEFLTSQAPSSLIGLYGKYTEHRFARLTAYLRSREPDDTINYSILVYRLTEEDIARALDGPAPNQ